MCGDKFLQENMRAFPLPEGQLQTNKNAVFYEDRSLWSVTLSSFYVYIHI